MSIKRGKLSVSVIVAAALFASHAAAQGYQDNNIVKGGFAYLKTNTDSGELTGPSTPPGVTVEVEDVQAVGLTYTRLIGEHFGIEVLSGLPFDVSAEAAGTMEGAGEVVTATGDAVILSGSYFFTPRGSKFRPYVSAGYYVARYRDAEASPALEAALMGETDIEMENSSGPGIYAGVNVSVSENWLVSGLVGYNTASTEVSLSTDTYVDMGDGPVPVGIIEREIEVDINPFVAYATVGFRF